MEPTRFRLEGPSLAALTARVAAEHGPFARIVAAEDVTVGGVRGFLARKHVEVTVELLAEPHDDETRRARHSRFEGSARLGIAALLADAENEEAGLRETAPPVPQVSTGSDHFAALMDDLTFNMVEPTPSRRSRGADTAPEPAIRALPPVPLSGIGDLVVVVGLADDAETVATAMATASRPGSPCGIERAGALGEPAPPWDRRRALSCRAKGVQHGHVSFVAFGLRDARAPERLREQADEVNAIGADQVWVAVDAGRKAEDTAHWVEGLAARARIDAVAVLGSAATASPHTVDALALPVGWVDGIPAAPGAPGRER